MRTEATGRRADGHGGTAGSIMNKVSDSSNSDSSNSDSRNSDGRTSGGSDGTGGPGGTGSGGTRSGGEAASATREARQPPPPGGMLWDLAGEVRALLTLPAALTLQVAHPAVGAGVDEHSVFRTDPWGRAERSLTSVQRWVYGGPEGAAEEGRRLRRLHRDIQGVDAHGREYHALTPAHYAWVHATGFPVYRHARPYLAGRPYTAEEERQLYAEWLQVGRVLGLQDRDMPQTVEDFWPYYRRMLAEELERTAVVEELVAVDRRVPAPDRGPLPVRTLLRLLWPVLLPAATRLHRFVAVGLLPPDAREALGLPWTRRQERRLAGMCRVLRAVVPRLPERVQYLPQAYAARKAYRAKRAGPSR